MGPGEGWVLGLAQGKDAWRGEVVAFLEGMEGDLRDEVLK